MVATALGPIREGFVARITGRISRPQNRDILQPDEYKMKGHD